MFNGRPLPSRTNCKKNVYIYLYGPKKDGLTPGSLYSFAIQRTRMDFMFGNKNDLYELSPQSAPKWATWVGVGVVDPDPDPN